MLAKCWFDATKTAIGLTSLRNYRKQFNQRLNEFKPTPVHDWASHPSDAFEVIAQAWLPVKSADDRPKPRFLHEITADEVFFPKERESFTRNRI